MVTRATSEVLTAEQAHAWILAFHDVIAANAGELSDLDRQSGDGDFGTNIASVLTTVAADLDPGATRAPAHFEVLARGFMNGGGTSGPLFGMWFLGFANAASPDGTLTTVQLAEAAEAGLVGVTRLGDAKPGDKTMVDAMNPAVLALRAAAKEQAAVSVALADAAHAARTGASVTASYSARRGRASYVGAAAQGVVDPGALAVALFFEAGSAHGHREHV